MNPSVISDLQTGISVKESMVILAILAVMLVGASVFGTTAWLQWKASLLLGKPETSVVKSLGQPRVSLTAAEVATLTPDKHPWDYADKPLPYPVTNKILHYSVGAGGVLIYINKEGDVEHLVTTDP